jgi:hypothetical protein
MDGTPTEGGRDARRAQTALARSDASAFRFGHPLGSYALQVRSRSQRRRRTPSCSTNGEQIDLGTLVLDASGPRSSTFSASANGMIGYADRGQWNGRSMRDAHEQFDVRIAAARVPGALALAPDGRAATFTPAAPLPDLRSVTVTLRADQLGFSNEVLAVGVRDRAGNSMRADFVFAFTTPTRRRRRWSRCRRPRRQEVSPAR